MSDDRERDFLSQLKAELVRRLLPPVVGGGLLTVAYWVTKWLYPTGTLYVEFGGVLILIWAVLALDNFSKRAR